MTYTLPETVSIGSNTFTFVRTKRLEFENLYGESNYAMATISFGVHTTGEKIPNTLMHELIHCIAEEYQIKALQDKDTMEPIISALANGLTRVLWDLNILPRAIVLRGEQDAAQERFGPQGDLSEHRNGDGGGQAAEAIRGNRAVESAWW